METRLSIKGQITLPKQVRQKLGLRAGDILSVQAVDYDSVTLVIKTNLQTKLKPARDVLDKTFGIWRDMPENGEEFVRSLRESDHVRMEDLDLG